VPYPERVAANFMASMAQQEVSPSLASAGEGWGEGRKFTDKQRWWLEKMAKHIASNLGLEADDFNYGPSDQVGRLWKVACRLAATCTRLAA
jgi:hypothetical protein